MNRIRTALCLTLCLLLTLPLVTVFAADGEFIRYQVKKGDTLSKIAGQHLSSSKLYPELLKYNDIKDANWIYPGDVIIIPKEDTLRKLANAADDTERAKIMAENNPTAVDTSFREAVKTAGNCDDPTCPRCRPESSSSGGLRVLSGGSKTCDVTTYENMDDDEMKSSAVKTRELNSRLKYAPIKAVSRKSFAIPTKD